MTSIKHERNSIEAIFMTQENENRKEKFLPFSAA
jgi:hypothetical protein